jgi:hypothetical protein
VFISSWLDCPREILESYNDEHPKRSSAPLVNDRMVMKHNLLELFTVCCSKSRHWDRDQIGPVRVKDSAKRGDLRSRSVVNPAQPWRSAESFFKKLRMPKLPGPIASIFASIRMWQSTTTYPTSLTQHARTKVKRNGKMPDGQFLQQHCESHFDSKWIADSGWIHTPFPAYMKAGTRIHSTPRSSRLRGSSRKQVTVGESRTL